MFHMLSCFNLKPETSIEEFSSALLNFAAHMKRLNLMESVGSVSLRNSDTPMDTDEERGHK
ncbi:MAG: hypothetical protein ACR2QW_00905, partial [bacterium]